MRMFRVAVPRKGHRKSFMYHEMNLYHTIDCMATLEARGWYTVAETTSLGITEQLCLEELMAILGAGTAYIDREGGFWSAFFYSDGDKYRYGIDTDYDALVSRMKRQGFKNFVNIADDYKTQSAKELDQEDKARRLDNIMDEFMGTLEEKRPKYKIIKRRK